MSAIPPFLLNEMRERFPGATYRISLQGLRIVVQIRRRRSGIFGMFGFTEVIGEGSHRYEYAKAFSAALASAKGGAL